MTLTGLPLDLALGRLQEAGIPAVRVLDVTARRNAQAPEVRVIRQTPGETCWTLTVCRFPGL